VSDLSSTSRQEERVIRTTVFLLGQLLLVTACSQAETHTDETASDQPVAIPAAELQCTDLDPVGAPGVQLATLWATRQRGASALSSGSRLE
ncbi:MAG TPA: hypothetical protein VK922_15425, partial [Gemmatimonadaceae bacterium]|nr:hypothetical protein [Gemmatimonadaceae bacterium]